MFSPRTLQKALVTTQSQGFTVFFSFFLHKTRNSLQIDILKIGMFCVFISQEGIRFLKEFYFKNRSDLMLSHLSILGYFVTGKKYATYKLIFLWRQDSIKWADVLLSYFNKILLLDPLSQLYPSSVCTKSLNFQDV